MITPSLDDTIVAVSTAWEPSTLGVVRLSGPDAVDIVGRLIVAPPADSRARPLCSQERLELQADLALPATVYWFRSPASYTGQDLVELHTVGCLPLLRALTGKLIELDARRALPGEFTSRAYLAGKLNTADIARVFDLIHAHDVASARRAARVRGTSDRRFVEALERQITELLALIEAGIDFVEEEDVRFISPAEIRQAVDQMLDAVSAQAADHRVGPDASAPHVALAGLPNAGKSTLFNALLKHERAIVSPILGTTRDVLSAEIETGGVRLLLQDCAGLGRSTDDLDSAAHLAAERAADQADLVLWVHDRSSPWEQAESQACRRIPAERRILVHSKADLSADPRADDPSIGFLTSLYVSAATGQGLNALRKTLATRISTTAHGSDGSFPADEYNAIMAALIRAKNLVPADKHDLAAPELIALELRSAWSRLTTTNRERVDEAVLHRIFAQFCVGK